MVICENWAVEPERAAQFFRKHASEAAQFFRKHASETDTGFRWNGCVITLTARPALLMGRWPTERTEIRIEGPAEEAKSVYHAFYLQFLSAGG